MNNSTRRALLENGLISALHEGLWQGPVQLIQHLISKLGMSNGEGSEIVCMMESRFKES